MWHLEAFGADSQPQELRKLLKMTGLCFKQLFQINAVFVVILDVTILYQLSMVWEYDPPLILALNIFE